MVEKGKGNEGKELFSKMIKAGQRTYFMSVRESSNGHKYLTMTESKLVEKDKFERFRIMVFQDKLGDFASAFAEACQVAA
jgi:hypothetical protein